MIEARHLRKAFTHALAVDDVSFNANRGAILGLIGPNGAGKTTTLRILLNIIRADHGEVLYDGKRFSEEIRNSIGYLPEERGLYRKSKVLDVLMYFGQLRGMRKTDVRARSEELLRMFDLETHGQRKTEELSKGNQQKVQFIATVVHNPSLIVFDEPFSGLDPINQELIQESLIRLKSEGKTIILSTHQMDYAERLSDTICLLDRGQVMFYGTTSELKDRYRVNVVRLEFSGDGSFLSSLPEIKKVRFFPQGAECEMDDGADMAALLTRLSSTPGLRKLEIPVPTLHSIFLEIIQRRMSTHGVEKTG